MSSMRRYSMVRPALDHEEKSARIMVSGESSGVKCRTNFAAARTGLSPARWFAARIFGGCAHLQQVETGKGETLNLSSARHVLMHCHTYFDGLPDGQGRGHSNRNSSDTSYFHEARRHCFPELLEATVNLSRKLGFIPVRRSVSG